MNTLNRFYWRIYGKDNKKETIHAAGIDIGIYTTDFKNEFISSVVGTCGIIMAISFVLPLFQEYVK